MALSLFLARAADSCSKAKGYFRSRKCDVKVHFACEDSSDSQELAVWYAVFACLWVCQVIIQLIVRMSGFGVEISG